MFCSVYYTYKILEYLMHFVICSGFFGRVFFQPDYSSSTNKELCPVFFLQYRNRPRVSDFVCFIQKVAVWILYVFLNGKGIGWLLSAHIAQHCSRWRHVIRLQKIQAIRSTYMVIRYITRWYTADDKRGLCNFLSIV